MNFIHSGEFRLHSCRNAVIPVDSCGFLWIPVPFLWIPVDSCLIPVDSCGFHRNLVIPAGM